MAIYVYNTADGTLASYCPNDTDPVADSATLKANGLAAISGLAPLDPTHAWNPATRTVVTVSAPVLPRPFGTGLWILRFTPAEFQAINASTDAQVEQWLYALNHTTQIDLNDPVIAQGVAYLVSINLLQSARTAAILA
jgi:hypothetical protein